ncbi:MAG: HAD hydrolase-like protein [Deltaproteobacteria bacterium]|nr:HAD hydrolase-like protein [Deltaproteobacteria bacterium]
MAGKTKLILWDIDGTLIRSGGAGARALDRAFVDLYGVQNACETIDWGGMTDPLIVNELIRFHFRREATPEDREQTLQGYLSYLPEEIERASEYRVMPGVREAVEEMHEHPEYHQGLGTGNLEPGGRIKLGRSDLGRYFEWGGFASDSDRRAELIRIGIERGRRAAGEHVPAERVVIIGDTLRDIEAARACGARVIAVATGAKTLAELEAGKPDLLVEDIAAGETRFWDWLKSL